MADRGLFPPEDEDGNYKKVAIRAGWVNVKPDGTIEDLSGTQIAPSSGGSDTHVELRDDGTAILSDPEAVDVTAYLAAADAGNGVVSLDVDRAAYVVDSPNIKPPALNLAAASGEDVVDFPVRVPDGKSLKVYRWGAFLNADGTAPTGLDVKILDGGDTVQANANTPDTKNKSSPVASHTNSSGSVSVFKLRVRNDTGTDYDSSTAGIGCQFGYLVE